VALWALGPIPISRQSASGARLILGDRSEEKQKLFEVRLECNVTPEVHTSEHVSGKRLGIGK